MDNQMFMKLKLALVLLMCIYFIGFAASIQPMYNHMADFCDKLATFFEKQDGFSKVDIKYLRHDLPLVSVAVASALSFVYWIAEMMVIIKELRGGIYFFAILDCIGIAESFIVLCVATDLLSPFYPFYFSCFYFIIAIPTVVLMFILADAISKRTGTGTGTTYQARAEFIPMSGNGQLNLKPQVVMV